MGSPGQLSALVQQRGLGRVEIKRFGELFSITQSSGFVTRKEEDGGSQRASPPALLSKHLRKCKLLFQIIFASKNGSLLQIFS